MTVTPFDPPDEHNQRLRDQVFPAAWRNPEPQRVYNLVVIGAGTAGLVCASAAAGLGARVALIEKSRMGGDCLNTGCVPSKALISAARRAAALREAADFGLDLPDGITPDFSKIMTRMRKLRADIAQLDSVQRYRDLGVEVFLGEAVFVDPHTLEVDGRRLRFKKAAICSGARAAVPAIPGLEEVPYLTNDTVFSLTALPKRLAVIGAGPLGCELAQCFARLGAEVTLFSSPRGILPHEDPQAAAVIARALHKDGVSLRPEGKQLQVRKADGDICLQFAGQSLRVDQLLVAAGRTPNVEGMHLEKAGVAYSEEGIQVNARLQTRQPHIYAAGDVCSEQRFTHAADFMARIVVQNALFHGRARADHLLIPHSTYTDPELAQVGLTPLEAEARGIPVDTFTLDMAEVDRCRLEGDGEGFIRVQVKKGSGQILGATVVSPLAGELISFYTLAIKEKRGLKELAGCIFPYPTRAEAVRKTGDLYNRTRLTPRLKSLLQTYFRWQRGNK